MNFELNVENVEDMHLAIPVVDVNTGVHYVNEKCAVCNGAIHTIAWKPRLTCVSSFEVEYSEVEDSTLIRLGELMEVSSKKDR